MTMEASTLADLIVEKLAEDPAISEADAELWKSMFTAIAEAIVEHLTEKAEVLNSDGDTTGETIR